MNLADTMYKARNQLNKWSTLSTEQEEIVALNVKITQLERMNKTRDKSSEKNKNKNKSDNKTRTKLKTMNG